MTFLPVVQRELRVASRERNTYRLRFLAALLPVIFCVFSLWVVVLLREEPIPSRGLFFAITWIAYVFVSIAGFCLTADTIAEEKRDSTLGLLFLTDLKGYDIVLGKWSGAGLRGLYALFATFPVLALPLIMGGSGVGEICRTTFILVLALLLSMSVGIVCSTLLRKTWAAAGLSFVLMLALGAGLPLYAIVIRNMLHFPELAHAIEICSPSYALMMSFQSAWGMPSNSFFTSIAVLSGLGLFLMTTASVVTPVIWKDRPPRKPMARVLAWKRNLFLGSESFRKQFRTRLFNINPVYWLTHREKVSSCGFLFLTAVLGGIVYFLNRQYATWAPILGTKGELVFPFLTWMFFAATVHLLLILRISVVAGEKFGEDRKSGALELLVSTPLQIKEVLRGQWLSLRRQFAGPAAAAFFLHLWPIIWLSMLVTYLNYPDETANFKILLRQIWDHFFSSYALHDWSNHFALLIMLGLIPILVLDWIAVAWTSMWLSLRVKRPIAAPICAMLLVHLPPWFIWAITLTWLDYKKWVFEEEFSQMVFAYALVVFYIISNQIFWSAFCRRQLLKHFRTAATDRYQPPKKLRWWSIRIA